MCPEVLQGSGKGKEPIPLDQEGTDDEEKVVHEAKIDPYITEPNDVGFEGSIGDSPYVLGMIFPNQQHRRRVLMREGDGDVGIVAGLLGVYSEAEEPRLRMVRVGARARRWRR
ncbi:uncharacterized protein A4U43_C07F28540 [Asparagus officinalis]|uniref:Uncharacterized protein n=1 Tax=Asparagus officinalis TaxID=4686 RepID=A0A5P1EFP8_ASPOF|nr:uncharacterized protein A4U43_C07F28540 [Asparagus officinalis]